MPIPAILGLRQPVLLICVATGVLYGLIARVFFGDRSLDGVFAIMSLSFIFFVPWVIGYLTIHLTPIEGEGRWGKWIMLPWCASLLTIAVTYLLAWEGSICALVCVPVFMVMSSIGGVSAGTTRERIESASKRGLVLASLVIFPFVLSPFEQRTEPATDYHVVRNQIEIDAAPGRIWEQVREVAPIREDEIEWSFSHWLGFPKPIEARLVGEGVGAVRYATFEGGVLFRETVTEWRPDSLLSFTIAPDSGIPATTFDDHVVVGGEYFDVLEGTYRIEQIAPNKCMLHLSSRQRVSTRFNTYTALWTRFFMSDIQETILEVVRRRVMHSSAG